MYALIWNYPYISSLGCIRSYKSKISLMFGAHSTTKEECVTLTLIFSILNYII